MGSAWELEDLRDASHLERQIVTAMVVSDTCLRTISASYKPHYLTAKFARTVADWCINYYSQYQQAPKGLIKSIYEAKLMSGLDTVDAALISQFLTSLSTEHEGRENFNEAYFTDQAINYFRYRGMMILSEDMQKWLNAGNLTQAQATLAKFSLPTSIASPGREPFADIDCCRRAFESLDEELFEVPGAFGELLKPVTRGSLVGLSALYKTGKSWLIDQVGLYAWYSGCNVALFDLEMGDEKRDRRLLQAITGLPLKIPTKGTITVACWDCLLNQNGSCHNPDRKNHITILDEEGKLLKEIPLNYRPCYIEGCPAYKTATWFKEETADIASWRKSWRKAQALVADVKGARFKAQSLPARSATLDDIDAHLDIWQSAEGFVADVVLIDYPALLRVPGNLNGREKVDEIWCAMRGLSQKRKCYLLAPTQAGGKDVIRKRDQGRDLGQEDVAEDSRILGHVEAMLKLDQTEEESEMGVARISKSLERHDDYLIKRQVVLLQALGAGVAVLDSKWK